MKPNTQRFSLLVVLLAAASVAAHAQSTDSRYDAGLNLPFNERAGEVNPQSGNLTLSFADVALPGRAGFDFTFSRTWSLNRSNVFAMSRNLADGRNLLTSDTIEAYNHLGVGWSSNLPYIFSDRSAASVVQYLVYGGGTYELDQATLAVYDDTESNIRGYDLLDLRVYSGSVGGAVTYGEYNGGVMPSDPRIADAPTDSSTYVLILKDDSRAYFRSDGRLLMRQDRTGLNRIWYFYESYQDEQGADQSRLALVVDTIGREISFAYTPEGNLEEIAWEVEVGIKDAIGVRSRQAVARSVGYTYHSAPAGYSAVGSLATQVSGLLTPYALETVTDSEGNLTRYEYEAGRAGFSYDSAFSRAQNVFLLLTGLTEAEHAGGFRNRRVFEYEIPVRGMHAKPFYQGTMEYYKLSRQYVRDRHDDRVIGDTRYRYYRLGERGNWSEYESEVQLGGLTTTYVYTVSDNPRYDQVLSRKIVTSSDGFLERTNYAYDSNRAKTLEEVLRDGQWVYSERFRYDRKGNLTRIEDRAGLVTTVQYDQRYAIPTETVRTVTSGGLQVEYKTTQVVNSLGQVTEQWIYLDRGGTVTPVRTALLAYDAYGNVVSRTDANDVTEYTVYDAVHTTFPVKRYQTVTIDAYSIGSAVSENWLATPDTTQTIVMRSWRVFNTDGTVWLELDPAGYLTEYYYDALGAEIERVTPDEDDTIAFASGPDFDDFYADYLAANGAAYFATRQNNPGVRTEIDYHNDFVRTRSDIDAALGHEHVTAVQGDGLGNVEQEIEYDGSGLPFAVRTMTYDDRGRIIATTDPDAAAGYTLMEIQGTLVQRTDKTWIVQHDELGRTKRVIYPETTPGRVHMKEISYDDVANSVTTTDAEGRTVTERYDWAGNLVEQIALGDSSTAIADRQLYHYQYDELGRRIAFTDPEGILTTYRYDERDLLVQQNYGTASDLMSYNDLGLLVRKSDRRGSVLTFDYDELGRNTRVTHYQHDGNANDIDDFTEGLIDHTVATAYDVRGNMVRVENPDLIEHMVYDAAGRVTQLDRRLTDTSLRTTLADRVWAGLEADQVFTFSYAYNDAGMVTTMTYPDGAEHNFSYDAALGRLTRIQDGIVDVVSSLSYNRAGVVTEMSYANGTRQQWSFDNRKRIQHLSVQLGSETLVDLSYTINGVGNVLAINDNEYAYDGLDRIVSARTLIPGSVDVAKLVRASFGTQSGIDPITVSGELRTYDPAADLNGDGRINGADHAQASFTDPDALYDAEAFTYDRNGNRTTLVQNGDLYRYSYGERNRLMSITVQAEGESSERPFATYQYDQNGNTTRREIYPAAGGTQVLTLQYDTLNRLVRSTADGEVTTYRYDNAGNRLVKQTPDQTTVYLRHGQIAVAMDIELPADTSEEQGRVNRYVLSGDLLAGRITTVTNPDDTTVTATSYYHLDHINSTKAVTDQAGVLEVIYEYRAFGEQLKRLDATGAETADSATYSYGGKELDGESNLYYFNARYYDATIGRFINVDPIQDGSNWYVYVRNNPLSFVDPTGLRDEEAVAGDPDGLPGSLTITEDIANISHSELLDYKSDLQYSANVENALDTAEDVVFGVAGLLGSGFTAGTSAVLSIGVGAGGLAGSLVNDGGLDYEPAQAILGQLNSMSDNLHGLLEGASPSYTLQRVTQMTFQRLEPGLYGTHSQPASYGPYTRLPENNIRSGGAVYRMETSTTYQIRERNTGLSVPITPYRGNDSIQSGGMFGQLSPAPRQNGM